MRHEEMVISYGEGVGTCEDCPHYVVVTYGESRTHICLVWQGSRPVPIVWHPDWKACKMKGVK